MPATSERPEFADWRVLEGSGGDTKLTVSFPGYGLKKLIAKYAGIKVE